MSDDDEYYEDDDYIYWEDEPTDDIAAFADDLAEHVVQSPVWTQDPGWEMGGYFSDMDYFSDDYYDGDGLPRTRADVKDDAKPTDGTAKRKQPAEEGSRKRQRVDGSSKEAHARNMPLVVWKTQDKPDAAPLLSETRPVKVSLLKDWRERCKAFELGEPLEEAPQKSKKDSTKATGKSIAKSSATIQNGKMPSRTKRERSVSVSSESRRTASNSTIASTASTATSASTSSAPSAATSTHSTRLKQVSSTAAIDKRKPAASATAKAKPATSTTGRKRKQSDADDAPDVVDDASIASKGRVVNGSIKKAKTTSRATVMPTTTTRSTRTTTARGKEKGK